MTRPMEMDKPSEPLGVSFRLEELQRTVARAIATLGKDTVIYGYSGLHGIALHAHFPSGVRPRVTFTEVD
jgi:hypothetical protein